MYVCTSGVHDSKVWDAVNKISAGCMEIFSLFTVLWVYLSIKGDSYLMLHLQATSTMVATEG